MDVSSGGLHTFYFFFLSPFPLDYPMTAKIALYAKVIHTSKHLRYSDVTT
jgi:hypothetical protein